MLQILNLSITSKKIGILPFLPSEMFTIPRFLSKENSPKSSAPHPPTRCGIYIMNAAKEYNVDETCTGPFIALHCFLSEVDSFKKVYRKSTGSV